MGYLVLARKYRPGSFGDVVGQEATVRTLRNALETGRIAHAYLFTGPRGVGKTSLARILARGLQCTDGPTPEPCGECERCVGISAGRDLDVVEIDGASNRGIENIRELRESVRYAPTSGRYMVFIVDEVHQITQDAFNAFLKTLEEPPAHVVFVFATTEPSKVPETIRSRCQVFEFRRVSEGAIASHVRNICGSEGLELEPGMDVEIARRARGGLRDALSLLDQLAAYGSGVVGFEAFRELTGYLAPDRIRELVQCVVDRDSGAALHWVGEALDRGASAGDLADQILDYLRALLHRKAGSARPPELPGVDSDAIGAQVHALDEGQLLGLLHVMADGRRHLREFDDVRLALEMMVLELVHVADLPALADVLGKFSADPPTRARRPAGGAPIPRRSSSAERVPVPSAAEVVPARRALEPSPATGSERDSAPSAPEDAVEPPVASAPSARTVIPPERAPSTDPEVVEASPEPSPTPVESSPPPVAATSIPVEPAAAPVEEDSTVSGAGSVDLDAPPFPPELEPETPELDDEPIVVDAPLPPLPPAVEVFQRLLAELRDDQPSNWALLEQVEVESIEGGSVWLRIDTDVQLDRSRLDPFVRERSREWYGRPLVLRSLSLRRERQAEDPELRRRLDLLQDRFGGGLARE